MTNEELGREIALGIINTGVEGGYDSVSCSTAGDYPSMGVSQWEGLDGGRGDTLLSYIDGGQQFVGRSYSDIFDNGELDALTELLGSEQGQAAQVQILAQDCTEMYVPELQKIETLDDTFCTIFAGIWCPTSHIVVRKFLINRQDKYDLRNIEILRDIFRDQYYIAADVGEQYAQGYANRSENTYQYILNRRNEIG